MRKRTIRGRFFASLAVYTLINFLMIGGALFSYDVYEYRKSPQLLWEEAEEVMIIGIVMLVLFPVSLVGAWGVSRWLLRPWRSMVVQAENIGKGRLDDRIATENPSDEIGRLAATLNRTFDGYQELVDRMHRFSYDASHQLRNPLAAIRTKSEVLLKYPRTAEEYRDAIADILDSTVRLGRTVDHLLLLARASGGALDEFREPIDLHALVREIVDEAVLIGDLRSVTVDLQAPTKGASILGVPDLIREALSNLVDNALKFTPSGGRIEVALIPRPPSRLRIEVSDSGPGLNPLERASIFRPFQRGGSQAKEGAGLGLAIVADVCTAHHGTFGVEDSMLGGARFWMEFPLCR